MGIEQIRMNQTKALPPVPQFNWSQDTGQISYRDSTCPVTAFTRKLARSGGKSTALDQSLRVP